MIAVALSWSELTLAVHGGVMRRVMAMKNGLSHRYGGNDESGWDSNINGAIAEWATAKHYGLYWDPSVGITTNTDVGELQVRSKLSLSFGMVIKPSDPEGAYVSVCLELGPTPRAILTGWYEAGEAKRADWRRAFAGRPEMYLVPRECLRPMSEVVPNG